MSNSHSIQVFLCHSSKDKPAVERIAHALRNADIGVWYDDWNVEFGDSISARINDGISGSDYVAVVLSPDSVNSRWVEREWSAAYYKEQKWGDIKVLPLLLRNCNIPPLLADRKYVDLRKGLFDSNIDRLKQWMLFKGRVSILEEPSQDTEHTTTAAAKLDDTAKPHPTVSLAHYHVRGAMGSNAGAAAIAEEVAGCVAASLLPFYPVALIDEVTDGVRFPFGELTADVKYGRVELELRMSPKCAVTFSDLTAKIRHPISFCEFHYPQSCSTAFVLETFRAKGLSPEYYRNQTLRYSITPLVLQIESQASGCTIRVSGHRYAAIREDKIKEPRLFFDFVTTPMSVEEFQSELEYRGPHTKSVEAVLASSTEPTPARVDPEKKVESVTADGHASTDEEPHDDGWIEALTGDTLVYSGLHTLVTVRDTCYPLRNTRDYSLSINDGLAYKAAIEKLAESFSSRGIVFPFDDYFPGEPVAGYRLCVRVYEHVKRHR